MTGPSTPLSSDRAVVEFVASLPTVPSRPMALLDRDTPLVAQMLEHELTFCPQVGVVVARLHLVKQVLGDPVTISRRPAAPSFTGGRTPAVIGAPAGLPPETLFLLNVDGREHVRLREVFVAGFSPAAVQARRSRMDATAARFVEELAPRGEVELVGEYAAPYPAVIVHDLDGFPPGNNRNDHETQAEHRPYGRRMPSHHRIHPEPRAPGTSNVENLMDTIPLTGGALAVDRPDRRRVRQFIAGAWRAGSMEKVLVDRNPFDGSTIAEFHCAGVADVDEAYRAAERAKSEWDGVDPYAKRAVFERAVRYVEDHTPEIVEIIIDELGGTRLKAHFEIGLTIDMLKEAGTFPLRMDGRILPSPHVDRENRVYREPAGVVGVISPFNFPLFLGMKSVAPALGAGNGVVLKPHEDTPIVGGTLIAEVFEAAGLPAGLLNVVLTEIPTIGDAFVEHPVPRVISFTGSAAVGRHVAQVAVRNFKKPILELGGNSALIVLADADLEVAVNAAVFSRFTHQGQVCMAANRVLVHRDVFDEFASRYVAKAASLPVGNPRDEATIIGPLINQQQADRLAAQVEQGIAEGARPLLRGGVSDTANGTLFHPTVLTDVTPEMSVMQDELFGPVACLMPFDTEDEAVAIANNTRFGLSGAVHTQNVDKGVELAKRIHTGMIHVNDSTIADEPNVPFGGEKQSGLGRMNGAWSLDEFTTLKWISIHRGRAQFPY